MFAHCIPHFLNLLLEQVLREQTRISVAKEHQRGDPRYDPLVSSLGELALELHLWSRGKKPLDDPFGHFRKRCEAIESQADQVSRDMWRGNCLNLVSVLDYAEQERNRLEGTFEFMLRTHYDIQRMRLLDQVNGARLLQNNNDLGDEIEKILVQYLSDNLGRDMHPIRGGHIFDSSGNRSNQMDIIIVPADSLAMCPADTVEGKHNVLVDQVVAALSVKSTLTAATFEAAWNDIQSIPVYPEKDSAHPSIKGTSHAWPLCFIMGANSKDTQRVDERWSKLCASGQRHQLQMRICLDAGYTVAGNSSWPLIAFHKDEYRGPFNGGDDLRSGLGLAWLLLTIAARGAVLARKDHSVFNKQREMLSNAELLTGCGCPTHSPRFNSVSRMCRPIDGVLQWDRCARWIHNGLFVGSVSVNGRRLVNTEIPLNKNALKTTFD